MNVGYRTNIGYIKAILKELGFPWNGKTCSIQQLLQAVKEYIDPKVVPHPNKPIQGPNEHQLSFGYRKKENVMTIIDLIKDLFYGTGNTLNQTFKQGTYGDEIMSFDQFKRLVRDLARDQISDSDIEAVFNKVVQPGTEDVMNIKRFEEAFTHPVWKSSNLKHETEVIRQVREWMFTRQYNTHSAFDRLVRTADRFKEKTLRRVDLHKAIMANKVNLNAA